MQPSSTRAQQPHPHTRPSHTEHSQRFMHSQQRHTARAVHRAPSSDDFDDELDDFDDFIPSQAKPLINEISEQVLPSDAIVIESEVGANLSLNEAVRRINSHFDESDLGYKPLRGDTFKLRVRSSRYPWFGAFSGQVHIVEDLGHHPGAHPSVRFYDITGVLRYRVSVLYVAFVALIFFLLLLWTSPGFSQVVLYFFFGVGGIVAAGYSIGRGQRDEVVDRIDESLIRLRNTIMNR